MAKRVCRTADRFDPTGMPRPRCRVRRVPPPPPVAVIHNILQWRPDTSRLGERCAVLAYRRTSRANCLPPYSRRATPPICPHLIFDRQRLVLATISSPESSSRKWRPVTSSGLSAFKICYSAWGLDGDRRPKRLIDLATVGLMLCADSRKMGVFCHPLKQKACCGTWNMALLLLPIRNAQCPRPRARIKGWSRLHLAEIGLLHHFVVAQAMSGAV
jgi:hypothetical protein